MGTRYKGGKELGELVKSAHIERNPKWACSLLVRLGRKLESNPNLPKENPEAVLEAINFINYHITWSKVDDFFKGFTVVKRYEDDGCWDYKSSNEYIKENLGERFTGDDFKHLIMCRITSNKYLSKVGFGYMQATSEMYKRISGKSFAEKFAEDSGIKFYTLDEIEQMKNKPNLSIVK